MASSLQLNNVLHRLSQEVFSPEETLGNNLEKTIVFICAMYSSKKHEKTLQLQSSHDSRNPFSRIPTRFHTNQPVQSQKQARSLKFRI